MYQLFVLIGLPQLTSRSVCVVGNDCPIDEVFNTRNSVSAMTEEEWLGGQSCCYEEMLDFLGDWISLRRRRLFACACVRSVGGHLQDERSRNAVEVAERYADGLANGDELADAYANAMAVCDEMHRRWCPLCDDGDILESRPCCECLNYFDPDDDEDPDMAAGLAAAAVCEAELYIPGCVDLVMYVSRFGKQTIDPNAIIRDLSGNPWRPLPARNFPDQVRALARACYDGDVDLLPLLADELAKLGEAEAAAHFRQGQHCRGCQHLEWIAGQHRPIPLQAILALQEFERRRVVLEMLAEARPGATYRGHVPVDPEFGTRLAEKRGCEVMQLVKRYVVLPADPRVRELVSQITARTSINRGPFVIALKRLLEAAFPDVPQRFVRELSGITASGRRPTIVHPSV
jgi:hypothetical protein